MSGIKDKKSTRRAFFLNGGAVLGAGVATTVGAAALTPATELQRGNADDREAIRQLQLAFMALVESQSYEAAANLFDERAKLTLSGMSASGKPAIHRLFTDEYRNQRASTLHSAYRQTPSRPKDDVTVSEDGLRATATFHCEVEVCTPLAEDCTAAKMARLQGQMASRRWETGRFEASYIKTRGEWTVASLSYIAS